MRYKPEGQTVSAIGIAQILLLLFAAVLPIVQWKTSNHEQSNTELQQLRAKETQYTRALNTLNDHRHITQAHYNKEDNIDSITLALIEAIKLQARVEHIDLTQLTVTQSVAERMASETNDASAHTLSVNLAMTMGKAMSLLSLFDALENAANWRPIEVRGCSVIRLTAQSITLQATCVIDVYYFPELDT